MYWKKWTKKGPWADEKKKLTGSITAEMLKMRGTTLEYAFCVLLNKFIRAEKAYSNREMHHNVPLNLALVDYENTCNSVEAWAVLNANNKAKKIHQSILNTFTKTLHYK